MTAPKQQYLEVQELLATDFDGTWGEEAGESNGKAVLRSTDMRGNRLAFDKVARRLIPNSAVSKKRLINSDILINKSSGSAHLVGASVIFHAPDHDDYYCSNFIRCLRPNSSIVDPEFLQFGLQSPDFRSQVFGAQRTTSGLRNIKISEYKSGKIPVPDSLKEQQRIVARIKECLGKVDEVEALRAASKTDASQLLRSFYSDLYQSLTKQNDTVPLGKVGTVVGGGTPSKKRLDFWEGSIPWVSPKEMKVRDLYATSLNITEEAIKGSSTRLISEPSVLFVVRGMILAHTLPVAINRVPVTMNQDMKAITPLNGMDVDYVATMLRGAEQSLLSKIEIAGHGTRRLQTENWVALPIPNITESEQTAIVDKVKRMESTVDALQKTIDSEEVEQLRESILHQAFSGEL